MMMTYGFFFLEQFRRTPQCHLFVVTNSDNGSII